MAVMQDSTAIERIGVRFCDLSPLMDERMRRQWAAAEATAYGWGGIEAVSRATGISPNTIRKGALELRRGGIRRVTRSRSVSVASEVVASLGRMPIRG